MIKTIYNKIMNLKSIPKKIKIPISLQVSIFLIIVAFIPVVVMMALNTYEKQQLSMLENSNVQQGRILSAALQATGKSEIEKEFAVKILSAMNRNFDSRIRILNSSAELIADSAILPAEKNIQKKTSAAVQNNGNYNSSSKNIVKSAKRSFIYRFFSFPIRAYRKLFRPPVENLYDSADFYNEKEFYKGEEIQQALNGKYGAKTRISTGNQISVTLYSAIPVTSASGETYGIVLVSRSTYRILQNLYELRLDLAKIYLRSLIAVLIIALFLTFRISFPLKKLSRQAVSCADKKGRLLFTKFSGNNRNDEIGELSRSFSTLIENLNKRIKFSQAFSSDISHEFKNPLTAIRSSAELLSAEDLDEEDRTVLSQAVIEEVKHLELLLNGIRKISRIDAGEDSQPEPVAVIPFIQNVTARISRKYPECKINVHNASSESENFLYSLPEDYFSRVLENLIDNAASFGTEVLITANLTGSKKLCITVEDNGKGIGEENKDKIFSRFYSERQNEEKSEHTGLGLSIVKAIAEAMEGKVTVEKSEKLGGACFTVIL